MDRVIYKLYTIPIENILVTVSKTKHITTINISFVSRSITLPYFFLGALNITPYQDLQNAIGANQLVTTTIIIKIITERSIIPANIANSHVNFNVIGNAKKHKHIKTTANPKFGHICATPDNSVVSLVPNLFCITSTRKNIKVDSIACIKQNNIPKYTIGVWPKIKHIMSRFIS